MKIGSVIRKWRNASDMTLQELADEMDVNLSTLARVETGEECSGDTLAKILVWLVAGRAEKSEKSEKSEKVRQPRSRKRDA